MPTTQTVSPSTTPINVAQAKQHLRVDGGQDNDYIASLIAVATASVEEFLRKALIQQTRRLDECEFPTVAFVLDMPPLVSVTSLEYTATDGSTGIVGSSVYDVDTSSVPGRVLLAGDQNWPSSIDSQWDAVRLTYVTGYATASSAVPVAYKHALKLLVERWYEHRSDMVVGTIVADLPHGVDALLRPTRNMRFV